MNEKVEKILDLLLLGLQKTGDIITEQTEPMLKEYVNYLMIDNLIDLIFIILIATVCLVILYKTSKIKIKDRYDDKAGFKWGAIVMSLVVLSGLSCGFFDTVKSIAQLKYSPKIVLMKDAAKSFNKCGGK